ncbi:FYRN-domain-containing protein [Scleroderma citrinum]
MSPSRSASALDRDTVMGPPPPPPLTTPAQQPQKDNQDINEKYRKLKRRYFDIEEKLKEAQYELKLSGERNAKLREDRELILQRVHELETRSEPNVSNAHWPPSSAFPRSLLSSRARASFVNNLRQAMVEDETEDQSADPMLSSRHLGPLSRKRAEDEFRDRTAAEEDTGDARRQTKRSRGPPKARDQPTPGSQSLVHLAPAPPTQQQQGTSEGGTPPLLVSNKGQKLRLKPPVKPSAESEGLSANARAPSPLSPILSPPEEHPTSSYSAGPFNTNGNAGQHLLPSGPSSNSSLAPGQPTAMAAPESPTSSVQPSEIQRHAKPKRLKAHTVTSKSFSIPTVPRDKKGRPILPLTVGIMTVHNLGEVCMREHFHTERYIFPVGYEVTRRYHSTVDPNSEAVYQCSILDGGDGPKFKIVGSDVSTRPIIAGTATGAWSNIVKQANAIRNRQHSNSVSGPDFFGLGQNTIKHLIQELPGANRLRDYVWQHFAEGG